MDPQSESISTQAVILLGGAGTRIASLYGDRPKALVPVSGKPFLQWQIEWLSEQGICDIHLAAGHMGDQLVQWAEDYTTAHDGIRITVSIEPERLGTAGAIKYIEQDIRSDPFLVLNGDSLSPNLNFQSLEDFHKKVPTIGTFDKESSNHWKKSKPSFQGLENAHITIAVTQIEEAGRYGTVEFNGENQVTAFREKAERNAGWINAGIYVVDHSILDQIEPGQNLSIETDIFPVLAENNRLMAFPGPPPMLDMGTPDGLENMETFLRA